MPRQQVLVEVFRDYVYGAPKHAMSHLPRRHKCHYVTTRFRYTATLAASRRIPDTAAAIIERPAMPRYADT